MGRLRLVSKHLEPGFIQFDVEKDPPKQNAGDSPTIKITTRKGTTLHLSKEMPLRQVARLVKMLEQGGVHVG